MGIEDKNFDSIFFAKRNNHEYISSYLFSKISAYLKVDFNLEKYNSDIINNIHASNEHYFDTIYDEIDPTVKLDNQQLAAVIADEKYSLIIAGAGAGKTTTVAAKVKYLVDKKHADPNTILVLSFTRNAVDELRQRINIDLGIPAEITTFHSLGYSNIRNQRKDCKNIIVDDNYADHIFLDYFREKIYNTPDNLEKFMNCFTPNVIRTRNNVLYGNFLLEHYKDFGNYDEYFPAYIEYTISQTSERDIDKKVRNLEERNINREHPTTIMGERMKSRGEAEIANFLYRHKIEYSYEKVYEEVVADNRIYRPDFTLNIGGEVIYVEYFGLSNFKGDDKNNTYNKNRRIKEKYHADHHTSFIALDNKPGQNITATLAHELMTKYGAKLETRDSKDIYRTYLQKNKCAEFYKVKDFFVHLMQEIKSSKYRNNFEEHLRNYINEHLVDYDQIVAEQQLNYILDFYRYYESSLHGRADTQYYDFSDLLYYGRTYVPDTSYKYIIIDEYQDISFERYALAQEVMKKSDASLVAVGDDWQTIYSFAGSKINYIQDFQEYFPGSKLFLIERTYRNAQELIDCTGEFIMRNDAQIKKHLSSPKRNSAPFRQLTYKTYGHLTRKLYCDIIAIHYRNPTENILILARKNSSIKQLTYNYQNSIFPFFSLGPNHELKPTHPINLQQFFPDDDLYENLLRWYDPNFRVSAMTIHKSKGLTSDRTYLLGLDKTFPSDLPQFWISSAIANERAVEPIHFAEERRVFYVALTRTKNNVTLCLDEDNTNRSPFVSELKQIQDEQDWS